MPAEPVTVTPPKHALPALTSYELRDYRRQLERDRGHLPRRSGSGRLARQAGRRAGRAGRPCPDGRRCVSTT